MTPQTSSLFSPNVKLVLAFVTGVIVSTAIHQWLFGPSSQLPIPFVEFPEPAWRTPSTLDTRLVASTPFARFEVHKVQTESGAIIDDWLWTDERSHVNILVHIKNSDKFMLFHQLKYGLTEPKYAAIGGLYDTGETPTECAGRELLEETGLVSADMIYLGAYRVQVNRGGGMLHAFYARNCEESMAAGRGKGKQGNPNDYEEQSVRLLSRQELLDIVVKEKGIGEAQWLATISTALLYDVHSDASVGEKEKVS